jgi:3-methyladenine DNA glycosylase AlkD
MTIHRELRALANPDVAAHALRFFRTGPGEYGEGDRFLGIRVPALRKLARTHADLPIADVRKLLASRWHEERLLALFMLVRQFDKGDATQRADIAKHYLTDLRHVNNWDLVDSSAHLILGPHLETGDRRVLDRLSRSRNLWERRIAMMTTFHFIRGGEFEDALRIAKQLLHDREDLIHKAAGWMLREIGKRDKPAECKFLDAHAAVMPRTMLRYAIEKFPARERAHYMKAGAIPRPK